MSDLREKVRNAILLAHDAAPDGQEPNAMADAAIAVCMEEAAPLVEQAFRHGIGIAQTVQVDDPDLAWETSRVRAALRALRGEGGVDDTNQR